MKVGSRIIFDNDGDIVIQFGDMSGDVAAHKKEITLDYIDIPYGSIDYSKYTIVGVDTATRQPIIEEIEQEPDLIQELQARIKELEEGI